MLTSFYSLKLTIRMGIQYHHVIDSNLSFDKILVEHTRTVGKALDWELKGC